MRPRLIISIALLTLAAAALAIFFGMRTPQMVSEPPSVQEASLPVVETSPDGITYETPQGSVRLRNFYDDAISSTSYTTTFLDDPELGAIYVDAQTRSINVVVYAIYAEELRARRPVMEQSLLDLLGTSKEDACKLPVFLNSFSRHHIGELENAELGLSFCPDAIPSP